MTQPSAAEAGTFCLTACLPQSAGDVRAIAGDPGPELLTDLAVVSPARFWVQRVEPRSLNAAITSRT
jgi:hypothetical protein